MEEIMNVKLISYSQTNPGAFNDDDYTEWPRNAQELVAYCARVSNPTNQSNSETSERLIKYLARHKHWSPFEMVQSASKSQQQETLPDNSCDTEVSHSKSSASDMLIQLRTSRLYLEKQDYRTPLIDKTV